MISDNATLRAKALLNRAAANGKPIRVFLGFRKEDGSDRLVAVDDMTYCNRTLPREELLLTPNEPVDRVVQAILIAWTRLMVLYPTAQKTATPSHKHEWRRRGDLRRTS